MKLIKIIKNFFYYDKIVESEKKNVLQTKTIIGLIIAIAFFVLTIMNIIRLPDSRTMLILTSISSGLIFLSVLLGRIFKKSIIIDAFVMLCCTAMFSAFAVIGGNGGFAALWIVLVPIIAMLVINVIMGVVASWYFFFFLIIIFYIPPVREKLPAIIDNVYNDEFILRFPLLYTISMALSIFAAYSTRKNGCMFILEQRKAEHAMGVDKMTGVHNRLAYEECIRCDFLSHDSIGAFFFDINNLKETNDTRGHNYGDTLIKMTAESLNRTLRSTERDCLFRIGGDEFVIVLKNISEKGCDAFINRWKTNLDAVNAEHDDIKCDVAYGYKYAEKGYDINDVLKEADSKMYENKVATKGIVCTKINSKN